MEGGADGDHVSEILHRLPLPGDGLAVIRPPTAADLEVVGADIDALTARCLREIDGAAVGAVGKLKFTVYNAVRAYVERLRDPEIADINAVARSARCGAVHVTLPDGRTALIEEPTVDVYHSATNYGRDGLAGGIRLLRRCLREVDGQPVDYATLVKSWPFDCPTTLLLHAELARLCSESAESVRSREGRVVVVG